MLNTIASQSVISRELKTGVSKDHFTLPHWYERDLEAVYRPRWLYAGHISELHSPNAFLIYALGDDEIVICRSIDGKLVAYYNFCAHRGHRLCRDDSGEMKRHFVCPYHGWVYSREDGSLLSAVRMNKDFDPSPYSLKSAWVEELHGLIFVCLADEKPIPVAMQTSHLAPAENGIGGYDFSRMKVASTLHLDWEANWKIVRENDDECYHCRLNHPELVKGYDPWHGFTVVEDIDNPQHIWTADDWALIDLGNAYNANPVSHVPAPVVEGKDGGQINETQFFFQPGGHLVIARDHAWLWCVKPLGPERARVTQQWFVADTAKEGIDYDVETLTDLFKVTIDQDRDLCENVQRGVRMRPYKPGPLNPHHQPGAGAFYEWYEKCLAAIPPKAQATA